MIYVVLTLLSAWNFIKTQQLNCCRYAYETGEDDEEGISLTGAGVVVGGELASKVERKERKASIATDHVFGGLGEDLEEDKRE